MKRKWKRVIEDPVAGPILLVIIVVMVWAFTGWLRMVLHGE